MKYIKFKEWDVKSLKIAYREAKRLGYRVSLKDNPLSIIRHSFLILSYKNRYFATGLNFFELDWLWYKHHKINPLRKLYYYLTT